MRSVGGNANHVVVVGAGLAGLSAALQLAGRGRAVTVVERGRTRVAGSGEWTSTGTAWTRVRPS